MKNNFANHTKTYTLHLWWLLTQYITLTRLFILIVSKFIGEKIAFEERLKSYGLRFTFVSFKVLIPPAPIGGRKERGGGGKGKKKRNIRKEVTRKWRAKNCQTALSDFKESLFPWFFPVPIICGTCRKSHKIAIELLPRPNCGCATHNWFR